MLICECMQGGKEVSRYCAKRLNTWTFANTCITCTGARARSYACTHIYICVHICACSCAYSEMTLFICITIADVVASRTISATVCPHADVRPCKQ